MMTVTALWRHPIKSHGREALERVTLTKGQSMPYDRLWAIAHDAAKLEQDAWAACQNFSRGAKSPALIAITARLDEAREAVTLQHPDLDDVTVQPDHDPQALLAWVAMLCAKDRAQPAQVARLDGRGYTDTPFASVSLCNTSTHAAAEALARSPLQPERWRGNIWFEGAPAWAEFDWLDRELKIGTARLKVEERITRCLATTTNTDTGIRDVDTLKALKTQGHQDFGVYLSVIETGDIVLGDTLELV